MIPQSPADGSPGGAPDAGEAMNAPNALSALNDALADPTLSDATRALLVQARDAILHHRDDIGGANDRYRAIFDAIPDPISVMDENGVVLELNPAGLKAYRRTREEVIGQSIHIINPELPENHLQPVWEALDRDDSYLIEVTNKRGDGTRFPVEVHSASVEFDGGRGIVAVARDLSRRHDADLRYRELMETIDRGIIVQDQDLRIVYANSAAMRIFTARRGHSIADELRSGRWMTIDERGRELDRSQYPSQLAMSTGRIVESTVVGLYHLERRQLIWLSITAVPQFPPDGDRPQQVLSLFSDVTALKRDSALFARAQALAHIGGWEWDAGQNRLYLTDEAKRILGREPDTIEAMLDGLRPADRERLDAALERTLMTEEGLELELQGRRADGETFWVRVIGDIAGGDPVKAHLTGTLQDITGRKRDEESLRVRARSDLLTGLLNRDAVLSDLDLRLQDAGRTGMAVLYIDLDRFKVVNDVLGHGAGDRLLTSAARRLRRAVGDEGTIARFGGDEFLVVCDIREVPDRPERLAKAILDLFHDSFRLDGEEFSITASIGIARAPSDGTTSQQLIQSADVAMYDSKRRGRNGWQSFNQDLAEQQLHRLQLETHLRRALHNDEFHLVYQPQVRLEDRQVIGVEALIRWNNEALGEMRPDRFIDHAETTGDIVAIGSWVLHEACRQLRSWRDQGLSLDKVAINVSYRQFLAEDLALRVAQALDEFDLDGSALELEFTERVLIEDAPDTLNTFARLRGMGVTLSIDDFGEGYSALNYLRRLPIHGLKLSQLFVQGVPDNQSDVAVCQAITGIAHSLGLGMVAEGIENERQITFLKALGVKVGQGFLFAPGLLPDELVAAYPSLRRGD